MRAQILVVVFLTFALFGCYSNDIVVGDVDYGEIESGQKIVQEQIQKYEDKISDLKSESLDVNEAIATGLISADSSREYLLKQVIANNSLINVYRGYISELEVSLNNFILKAAGKDEKSRINITGTNVTEVAEAYMLIKQTDQQLASSTETSSRSQENLRGILVNERNFSVIAQVSAPGFYREFNIPRKKAIEFNLPFYGRYSTIFISTIGSDQRAMVEKKVGPGFVYYKDGVAYDYMATAIKMF